MATVFAVIPVFNRLNFTRQCIKYLKAQTFQSIKIIVSDGGSTDGTIEAVRGEYPDVVLLTSDSELWWAGAMAMGIDYALHESLFDDDCVLMMNNDTQIPDNYVATLMTAALTYDAAVGALVVDSRDATHILDAGEYIDWENYTFPVKNTVTPGERFCDDVDVLPGRGSLVPMRMIRAAGNVDDKLWPHYLADYEFFCRLKHHGFRLGVCYETQILAHVEETGIVPTSGKSSFRSIWNQAFSRRSMSNVIDHWKFVGRHAPKDIRLAIRLRLIRRVISDFTLRTPLRPLALPIYWLLRQCQSFRSFAGIVCDQGIDALCHPRSFPGLIRLPLYFLASPGPLKREDIDRLGLCPEELLSRGVLRRLDVEGWYALNRIKFLGKLGPAKIERLFWFAWNPQRKLVNTMAWRNLLKKTART